MSRLQCRFCIAVFLCVLLVFGGSAYAAFPVTTCGNIGPTGGTYELQNDLTSAVDCINITGANIIFDGKGHTITMTSSKKAVMNIGHSGVTVRNLNIVSGTVSGVYGIYAVAGPSSYVNSMTIQNNVIRLNGDNSFGIYLHGSSRIESNTLVMDGEGSSAVYLYKGGTSRVLSNNITSLDENSYGIKTFEACLSQFSNNNITTFESRAYPIYVFGGYDSGVAINITHNRITSYEQYANGIYLYNATRGNVSQNTINTYKSQAIYIMAEDKSNLRAFDNNIDATNTEQGMPIYYYYNKPVNLVNVLNIGQLYIVNSNSVYIKGVRVLNDGITLAVTNNAVIEDSYIDTKMQPVVPGVSMTYGSDYNIVKNSVINSSGPGSYGFVMRGGSDHNTIFRNQINATIGHYCTYQCMDTYGGYVYYSNYENVSENVIITDDNNGYGLHLKYSTGNIVLGNTIFTSGIGAFGVLANYTYSSVISNNTIYTDDDCEGIKLQSALNNNVTVDIFDPLANYDYSLFAVEKNNMFKQNGFNGPMNINLFDTGSWFNYVGEYSPDMILKTNVSVSVNISRDIFSWTSSKIWFNETPSAPFTAGYSFQCLPDTEYEVNINSGGSSTTNTLTTGSNGLIFLNLPVSSETEIEIFCPACLPPTVYDPPLVSVINSPVVVSSLGTETFDVVCTDMGGGCDTTVITAGPYSCTVDHNDALPDSCSIALVDTCDYGTYAYDVDTVDNYGNHNTSVNGVFEVKMNDGCSCFSNDECFNNSCTDSNICMPLEIPVVEFFFVEGIADVLLGESAVLDINIVNSLGHVNIINLTVYGDPNTIEPWLYFSLPNGDTSNTISVTLEPNSNVIIPINVFGGKTGTYTLTVFAKSQINGLEAYDRGVVNIVQNDDYGMYTDTPGMTFIAVVMTLVIAGYLVKERGL